ncbi:cytochrome P450 2 subfamily U member 1 [Mactra antiquata]
MIRKAFCSKPYAIHLNNKQRSFSATHLRNNCQSLATLPKASDPLYKRLKKVFIAALHSYGSGLKSIENKVLNELENVREKINGFKGKEFDFDVIIKRSLTNIMSLVNEQSIRHNKGIVDYYLAEQTKQKLSGNEPFLTDERIKTQLSETIDAEIQTKIQEELDRVVGNNRSPTFSDRLNCHYLMAFEKEVHRLLPSMPRLLPHYCYDDIVFEGYFVPKGSIIVPNIWSVHHDEKLWRDPWNARPERFLDEDGFLLPSEHIYCSSVIPFGLGDRRCTAETYAKARHFLFLSTLLQRYTFKFAEGSIKRSCDPRNVDDFVVDIFFRVKPISVQAVERV